MKITKNEPATKCLFETLNLTAVLLELKCIMKFGASNDSLDIACFQSTTKTKKFEDDFILDQV